jgi:hypothetical protein
VQSCPVPPQWSRPFPDRLVGALRLDATVFEEVERDEEALGQAAGVIALASLAQALGGVDATSTTQLFAGILGMLLAGYFGWVTSTAIIWLIGVKMLGGASTFPRLLRALGFAAAPKILFLLGVLPLGVVRNVIGFGVVVLTTIAFVIAVRQALDATTGRAVLVCVLGVVASFVLAAAFGALVGIGVGVAR